MTIWNTLDTQMGAGIALTYEQLEEALAAALQERHQFYSRANRMNEWLVKLLSAHLEKDVAGLLSLMDGLAVECNMAEANPGGSVH